MTIDLDGVRQSGERYFLVLATTLRRLVSGRMPFWGADPGGLRDVDAPADMAQDQGQ